MSGGNQISARARASVKEPIKLGVESTKKKLDIQDEKVSTKRLPGRPRSSVEGKKRKTTKVASSSRLSKTKPAKKKPSSARTGIQTRTSTHIKLTKLDAVFGRGRKTNAVRQKNLYRDLVQKHYIEYAEALVENRNVLVKENIIDKIVHRGGRFIMRVADDMYQLHFSNPSDRKLIYNKVKRALFNERKRREESQELEAMFGTQSMRDAAGKGDSEYEGESSMGSTMKEDECEDKSFLRDATGDAGSNDEGESSTGSAPKEYEYIDTASLRDTTGDAGSNDEGESSTGSAPKEYEYIDTAFFGEEGKQEDAVLGLGLLLDDDEDFRDVLLEQKN